MEKGSIAVVNTRDSVTRTNPEIARLVNDKIPRGYVHVDADIDKNFGVQEIITKLINLVQTELTVVHRDEEFTYLLVPQEIRTMSDRNIAMLMFLHVHYTRNERFRNEVAYIAKEKRPIKDMSGSFPHSEVRDNQVRFSGEELNECFVKFDYLL